MVLEVLTTRKRQIDRYENYLYGDKVIKAEDGKIVSNLFHRHLSIEELVELRKFCDYLSAIESQNVSRSRRMTIIHRLYLLKKNACDISLLDINEDNIMDILSKLNRSKVAPTTKQGFRQALRKFLIFREYGSNTPVHLATKGYPTIVKLIPNGIPKNERRKVNVKETLTRKELSKIINSADNVRDKAFVSVLIETGARISEILGLRIGDLKSENLPPRFVFDLHGKTGHRQNMCVLYFRHLSTWINSHPLRNTEDFKEQPLFLSNSGKVGEYKAMTYATAVQVLRNLKKISGIKKPVNPHNFRHTWVTHRDQEGWNVSQIANAVGWSKNSRQFANYSHTSSKTSMDKRLEDFGIQKKKYVSQHITCEMADCLAVNSTGDDTCWSCNSTLKSANPKVFGEYSLENINDMKQVFDMMLKHMKNVPNSYNPKTSEFGFVNHSNYNGSL